MHLQILDYFPVEKVQILALLREKPKSLGSITKTYAC
jgi:hypothetical protein